MREAQVVLVVNQPSLSLAPLLPFASESSFISIEQPIKSAALAGQVQIRMYPTHVILAACILSCGHVLMPCSMQIIDRTQITNFRQIFNVKMHYTVATQNSDYLKVPISDKFLTSKCMTRTVDRIQIAF